MELLATYTFGQALLTVLEFALLVLSGLPQLVGIFGCRDSRFACKSWGEVAARSEIL